MATNPVSVPKGSPATSVGAKPYTPVYYPACCVNLTVRFDEALTLDSSSLPTAQSPDDKAQQGGLGSVGSLVAGQATKVVQKLQPLVQDIGDANLTQVVNLVPQDGSFELPGYRQAGKFNFSLAWQDFPIDPRAIRAIGVEIYAAAIPPDQYAAGMVDSVQGLRPSMFQPRSAYGFANDDNLIMVGVVDEIDLELSDKKSELVFEGRDVRGILLDSPIQATALRKIDLSKPIDEVVQQILDLHPRQTYTSTSTGKSSKYFVVAPADPSEWPNKTVPSPAAQDDLTRVRLGTSGKNPQQSPPGEPDKLNFWDIITNYCYLVGAIPYFSARTVKVRPARSIYDLANAGEAGNTAPTPFAGGKPRTVQTATGADRFSVRRLVYGRDITKVHLARKCGGVQTPAVTVVSLDTSSDQRGKAKLLEVTYPSKETISAGSPSSLVTQANKVSAAQAQLKGAGKIKSAKSINAAERTAMSPDGSAAEVQTLRVSVPGVNSKQKLIEIARNLYEEIGRQEIGGSASTRDLASVGGDNGDPDMLRVRPGDAVQMLVDQRALSSQLPLVAPMSDLSRMSFGEAVVALQKRLNVNANFARVLVATSRNVVQQFSTYFRVSNVKYNWGLGQGIGITFDFQNYIEVRSQVDQSPGS